jgi:flagellar biosynthetic protein FlhB
MELNTFFGLGGFLLALMMVAGSAARDGTLVLRAFLMNAHLVPSDGAAIQALGVRNLGAVALGSAGVFGLLLAAALAGALIQHRPLWTFEPLTPKLSKLSPLQGAKRLFGKEALANFVKGVLKIVIVGAAVGIVLVSESDRLDSFAQMDVAGVLPATLGVTIKMLGAVVAIYFFVGIGDFVYQRFTWMKRQRMTREELKQEYKDTDGNPEIKAKLRQLRTAQARRRMMQKVPQATVIITNPTHYAVALRYEPGMEAPVCLAKGLDAVALKIREVAGAHDVPIVENPPLARALHATVELDDSIAPEHYKAVAEVIGFVLRARQRRR